MRMAWRAGALGVALLAGCEPAEEVRIPFRDMTPHEAYAESLKESGLAATALGREWIRTGRVAMSEAVPVSLPFEEEGRVLAGEPDAVAYRVAVPRGRKLAAEISFSGDERARVFVDLFRAADDEADIARPVVSSDGVPVSFVHEPWRGGEFVLRIQPELLRQGRYRVSLKLESQLSFPVAGRDTRAIQSFFGADRDAGARRHEGVDIFARRGTPVLAAAPGRAYRIGITNLGGKVVWVRDDIHNARVYYAHLDSQAVVDGERIEVGDTLGFVGNTGNARTTPPHLHFGVYRSGRGAIDPLPFLRPPTGALPVLTADLEQLGGWVGPAADGLRLRAAPGTDAPILRELSREASARVLAATGDYLRVRLTDGTAGYVAARLTRPVDAPPATRVAARDASPAAPSTASESRGATE
jgi:murein DD-endopeptidase MepM/ murein hydrolase activator NlpD